MSRIGKKPIPILDGVKVAINGRNISVEGPQGKLSFEHRPEVSVTLNSKLNQVEVVAGSQEREARAFHGLTRALIQNMVSGVKIGYEKRLEVIGVGYVASIQGKILNLRVGYANEVKKQIPDGLKVTCPDQTHVLIQGCDKQKVGQFAAEVRASRKPEPYKGKGVRYQGEHIKLKPGKTAQ